MLGPEGLRGAVDLGDAATIETRVQRFRKALAEPNASGVRARGRALAANLAPIAPFLEKAKHLYLSPDGALDLVPFGALPDASGAYLLEEHRYRT